jgi:hypothetical protein
MQKEHPSSEPKDKKGLPEYLFKTFEIILTLGVGFFIGIWSSKSAQDRQFSYDMHKWTKETKQKQIDNLKLAYADYATANQNFIVKMKKYTIAFATVSVMYNQAQTQQDVSEIKKLEEKSMDFANELDGMVQNLNKCYYYVLVQEFDQSRAQKLAEIQDSMSLKDKAISRNARLLRDSESKQVNDFSKIIQIHESAQVQIQNMLSYLPK